MNPTPEQLDALKELTNIGIGQAGGVLNEMLDSHVSLEVPSVNVLSPEKLEEQIQKKCREKTFSVRLDFKGRFAGTADLTFPVESASNLVIILTGDDLSTSDLDSIRVGTLTEVGNIVLNGVMGSIANILGQHINYSVPSYMENAAENPLKSIIPDRRQNMILVRTRFTIKQFQIEGDILLVFEEKSLDMLLEAINAVDPAHGG